MQFELVSEQFLLNQEVTHCAPLPHSVVLHCSMKRIGLEIEGTEIQRNHYSCLLLMKTDPNMSSTERRDLEKKGNPIYFPLVSFVPSHHSPFIFVKEQQFSLKRNIASFFGFQTQLSDFSQSCRFIILRESYRGMYT